MHSPREDGNTYQDGGTDGDSGGENGGSGRERRTTITGLHIRENLKKVGEILTRQTPNETTVRATSDIGPAGPAHHKSNNSVSNFMNDKSMTGGVGTPAYMAPELMTKTRFSKTRTSTAVDVYSFGVLLIVVRTRQRPYKNMSDAQIIEGVQTRGEKAKAPRASMIQIHTFTDLYSIFHSLHFCTLGIHLHLEPNHQAFARTWGRTQPRLVRPPSRHCYSRLCPSV